MATATRDAQAGDLGARKFVLGQNSFQNSQIAELPQAVVRLLIRCIGIDRWSVTLAGELILARSRDPEHDAARELLARGYTGKAETVDAITGAARMRFSIEAFAATTVEETSDCGLRVRRWRGHRFEKASLEGGISPRSAFAGAGGTGEPAELLRILRSDLLEASP
jgi:hypothetical protein